MVIERVSVVIRGRKQRKEKKQGVGEGKDIVATERFLIATLAW